MGSHGIWTRSPSWGWAAPASASAGTNPFDDLLIESAQDTFASAGVDQARRRRLLDRHRPGRGMSGITLARPLQLPASP